MIGTVEVDGGGSGRSANSPFTAYQTGSTSTTTIHDAATAGRTTSGAATAGSTGSGACPVVKSYPHDSQNRLSALFIDAQCGHDTGATATDGATTENGGGGEAPAPDIGAPQVSHHSGSPEACPFGQVALLMARA
ncbi:MAG: hypothetical protein FD127_4316 [Acidimicrobiaceae bacterium]|nr:MAG: hypothetical protein FD127_4316 [Acidimicrobiaceae bacterium]